MKFLEPYNCSVVNNYFFLGMRKCLSFLVSRSYYPFHISCGGMDSKDTSVAFDGV